MDVDGIMESSKGGMSFGVATRDVNELGTEYRVQSAEYVPDGPLTGQCTHMQSRSESGASPRYMYLPK